MGEKRCPGVARREKLEVALKVDGACRRGRLEAEDGANDRRVAAERLVEARRGIVVGIVDSETPEAVLAMKRRGSRHGKVK